jgi:hypothetical protein
MAYKPGWIATNADTQTYVFPQQVLTQPAAPAGYPSSWGPTPANYDLDATIVNNPVYHDAIVDALAAIPTMSVVLDVADFFGPQGIYSNPSARGDSWEAAMSLEYFDPADPTRQFQEDAGIQLLGSSTRDARMAKHTMRVVFKKEFGAGKLRFPLFTDSPIDEYNSITLLQGGHDGWVTGTPFDNAATYLRDAYLKQSQVDMDEGVGAHGDFVHLYINGLYWGMYHITERPDDEFAASYLGGQADQYDAIKHYSLGDNQHEVVSGDSAAWNQMMALAAGNVASDAGYNALKQYLDMENFIDYLIVNMHAANDDWPKKNWYAVRKRETGAGFRFFNWDGDFALGFVATDTDRTNVNNPDTPGYLYSRLRQNTEFRLLFADRIQKHLFNDGTQTLAANQERFQKLADRIDLAIVAESARWGDAMYLAPGTTHYTRNDDWVPERDRVLNEVLPQRQTISLGHFRAAGLMSTVESPGFSINGTPQWGGDVISGASLSITSPPQLIPLATTLINASTPVRTLVPADDSLGITWTQAGFSNLAAWQSGPGTGVGFEANPGSVDEFTSLLQTDLRTAMHNLRTSVFIRQEFTLSGEEDFASYILSMKFDDGFVAYIDGQEVARFNVTSTPAGTPPTFNATATQRLDSDAVVAKDFDLGAAMKAAFPAGLSAGTHVLAIHGINQNAGSSDLLFLPVLQGIRYEEVATGGDVYYTTDGSDPRNAGGAISPSAVQYSTAFPLLASTQIRARTMAGGVWSAISEATYSVNTPLRITELNYHPADPSPAELAAGFDNADDFEFLELKNISDLATLDLAGAQLSDGVELAIPSAR